MVLRKWLPNVLPYYYQERQKYAKRFPIRNPKVSKRNRKKSCCHKEEDELDILLATQRNLLRHMRLEHKALKQRHKQKCANMKNLKDKVESSKPLQQHEEHICHNIILAERFEEKIREDTANNFHKVYDSLTKLLETMRERDRDQVEALRMDNVTSESSIIDLCPFICESETDEEHLNSHFSSNSLFEIPETMDLSAPIPSNDDIQEVDIQEETEVYEGTLDETSSEESEEIDTYCLHRTDDKCTERLKHLKRMKELDLTLIDRRMVELAERVAQMKALKRSLINNVRQLRSKLREVSFQLMDMRVRGELLADAEPHTKTKNCNGKKRCKVRGVET